MAFDWKDLVKNVAPVIGAALGGPLAGAATRFLAEAWLGKEDATEQELAEAIVGASPEQLVKLRELDQSFKLKMRELEIDVFRLEVDDRKSARDLARADMRPQIILSVIYTIGYFTLMYQFVTGDVVIPIQNKDLLLPLIGVMTAAQIQIMNFWFGSSSGSKAKDESRAAA